MRKILTLLATLMVLFILAPKQSNAATNVSDSYASVPAKITPFEYSYLLKNAGIATYVYTDFDVNLTPTNLGNFTLINKGKTYIVVKQKISGLESLITNKGLVVTYMKNTTLLNSKNNFSLSSVSSNSLYNSLLEATKTFVGPIITKANYINFEQLNDNKALFLTYSTAKGTITIPSDATISMIHAFDQAQTIQKYNPNIFTPGSSHEFDWHYGKVDNISIGKGQRYNFYISYTADSNITYTVTSSINQKYVENVDLVNKFQPYYTDIKDSEWFYNDVNWAVLNGLIQGYEDGSYNPLGQLTESQFISILTKYYGVKTLADSNEYDSQSAYSYFNQIVTLDGWKDTSKRVKPISRGKVAVILSATMGGPKTQNEAIQFLIENKVSTHASVAAFDANGNLKRSQIAAFFQRLNQNNFTEIK